MERKPTKTTTMIRTEVTAMAVNVVSREAQTITLAISGGVIDEEKIVKAVQTIVATETVKILSVIDSVVTVK